MRPTAVTILQQPTRPRWVLAVLTALMVVGTLLLAAGTASAATGPAAENRIRASASTAQTLDRPPSSVSADQRLGNALPQPGIVVAAGVAANTARRTPELLRVGDFKLPAVPKGAVGTPTQTGKGMEYVIPRGTPEISEKVASVRIMDPVTTGKYQYPDGYAVYTNGAGQTVNPLTGQTIARADPYAHVPSP